MNLTLDPQIRKLIEQRVTSGRYKSAEDVVAAALASLGQQERLTELAPVDLEKLYPGVKQALQAGLVQARAGRIVDGEEFFEALESEDGGGTEGADRKTA